MNITIIPGSYKPPHKGHLSLVEKLIKKNNNSKIIIIISKKSRPLDSRFLYMKDESKETLQNALIEYLPDEKDSIIKMSKTEIIKKINMLIEKNILKSINSIQSLKVWNIYLKYLKKKYINSNIKLPKIIFKIPITNNIIIETMKTVLEEFKNKPKKIILMKSKKNEHNTRFKILENRFHKYIHTQLFPDIKDIDATSMRKAILDNDEKKFLKYLPQDLDIKDKNKVWNICK